MPFPFPKISRAYPQHEEGYTFLHKARIDYVVLRKARRRRITMFIEPTGRLRFLAPLRVRTEKIDLFLHRNAQWVAQKLGELRQYPCPHFPNRIVEGTSVYYLGAAYAAAFSATASAAAIDGAHFVFPQGSAAAATQDDLKLDLMLWYKKQARHELRRRADHWANLMGVTMRSFKITSPTRQWGSCSARNDVRLNWRVMMAAPEVIDYLIVHELAHITHKNHSPRFWQRVAAFLPDYKARQQILMRMDAGFSL